MADLIEREPLLASMFPCAAKRQVEEAPAVNRWIPCSERLPDDETRVIAVIDGESREAFFSYDAFIGSNFYCDKSNVPYWMPMPNLPKEVDDNG